jgi:hypothetical protein
MWEGLRQSLQQLSPGAIVAVLERPHGAQPGL